MIKSELIKKYADDIKCTLFNCYRDVLESDGRIQYSIYLWEDGQIECLEGIQGDNTYLAPKTGEKRKLHYLYTVSVPNLDLWDYTDHSAPDNEEERETEKQEIIEYLMSEYQTNISDVIDGIIDEAEKEERYCS